MNDDERTILWLAIEDFSGMWEVVWQLRSLRPEDSDAELNRRAKDVLSHLLQRGWADLYHCEEPYGRLSKIPSGETDAILGEAGAWEEPQAGAISKRIGATAKGRKAYER
jgi:hypothetical protein